MALLRGKKESRALNIEALIRKGVRPTTPPEMLRTAVQKRMNELRDRGYDQEETIQGLFPTTILEHQTLESLTTSLLAGDNVLFFGPPGSGKTQLAKAIWDLIPKQVYVVATCPVHDDPFSLVDPGFSRTVPPCPHCKSTYGDGEEEFDPRSVDPASVPVKLATLREGFGMARVQGSPEVFPDHLTGTVNLHKLEKLGDPTNPLVLEPGKLLQANRGLLIVDEIGKLPMGTQNVLLQALQEHVVTPSRSRETFPASFIAVTTSNLDDLENINEPLNDRLSNIYVGFNRRHKANRRIMDLAVTRSPHTDIFIPEIFKEAGVYLIERWRAASGEIYEFSEVGSNRTMIDIITRSEAYAILHRSGYITRSAFTKAVYDAMLGRIRARSGDSFVQNKEVIEKFCRRNLEPVMTEAATGYWCTVYREVLGSDEGMARRLAKEIQKAAKDIDFVKRAMEGPSPSESFRRFATFVRKVESSTGALSPHRVVHSVCRVLAETGVFECPE